MLVLFANEILLENILLFYGVINNIFIVSAECHLWRMMERLPIALLLYCSNCGYVSVFEG